MVVACGGLRGTQSITHHLFDLAAAAWWKDITLFDFI